MAITFKLKVVNIKQIKKFSSSAALSHISNAQKPVHTVAPLLGSTANRTFPSFLEVLLDGSAVDTVLRTSHGLSLPPLSWFTGGKLSPFRDNFYPRKIF